VSEAKEAPRSVSGKEGNIGSRLHPSRRRPTSLCVAATSSRQAAHQNPSGAAARRLIEKEALRSRKGPTELNLLFTGPGRVEGRLPSPAMRERGRG